MATLRSEEEQVEALRKWWAENGRSTMTAIVVALAAGFGWQAWQGQQQVSAETASLRYEEMLEAVRQPVADEAQLTTIRHLATQLVEDFPGTSYAQFANLHLARLAVLEGDYTSAEQQLRAVLTSNPTTEIQLLTQLRLARVVAAQGKVTDGLAILDSTEAGAYEPAYREAAGDMYMQLGQEDAARQAYQEALALTAAAGTGGSETLSLKLQALNPVPARSLQTAEAAVVEE